MRWSSVATRTRAPAALPARRAASTVRASMETPAILCSGLPGKREEAWRAGMTISVFTPDSSSKSGLEQVVHMDQADRLALVDHEHMRALALVQRAQDVRGQLVRRNRHRLARHYVLDAPRS